MRCWIRLNNILLIFFPSLFVFRKLPVAGITIRVINNHFETTSVNSYSGIITAPGKDLKIRMKAIRNR